MARGKQKVDTASDDRQKLIEALKFAAIATKDGEGKFAFVQIRDHWLTASNDTFTIGTPTNIGLNLCPQAEQFLASLSNCGASFQVTQTDMNSLSIRSGNFRALVPALRSEDVQPSYPDDAIADIDDRLREAMAACVRVIGKGERVIDAGALMQANTMTATSGRVLIEYWHGIDLPGHIIIPKKTLEIIGKINKRFSHFGFSNSSITIWFEDGSFIKTRLVDGTFPDAGKLWDNVKAPYQPIWPEYFASIDAISKFIKDDVFYWNENNVSSDASINIGATYAIQGVPGNFAFSPLYWRQIEPFVQHIAIPANPTEPIAFKSQWVHGLLMGKIR